MSAPNRPITLTIAALGGQGGGVVQGWMIDVAQRAGYQVQATSVPGVAQRTGATIYYLEFYPGSGSDVAAQPVMALMPVPGNCDLVVAAELLEAARMIERGFVDSRLTTLVSSTHRAYTIDEKSHLADGRADTRELMALAEQSAATFRAFDMATVAQTNNAVISAAMLGAIAGAGVLPFPTMLYEDAIRHDGRAVEANLAAFRGAVDALREAATETERLPANAQRSPRPQEGATRSDARSDDERLPSPIQAIVAHARPRLEAYQDAAYAEEYQHLLQPFLQFADNNHAVAVEVARGLALWMTYEDTIRVAEIKTDPERLRRLVRCNPGEISYVTEFMKPRPEEIAGTLPARLGRALLRSTVATRLLSPFTRGLRIRSTRALGYAALRSLARLKRWRRGTLRHQQEHAEIGAWLEAVHNAATHNQALGAELASCQELIKGYGDTHAHGLRNYKRIAAYVATVVDRATGNPAAATIVRELREAALQDDTGAALDTAFARHPLEHAA